MRVVFHGIVALFCTIVFEVLLDSVGVWHIHFPYLLALFLGVTTFPWIFPAVTMAVATGYCAEALQGFPHGPLALSCGIGALVSSRIVRRVQLTTFTRQFLFAMLMVFLLLFGDWGIRRELQMAGLFQQEIGFWVVTAVFSALVFPLFYRVLNWVDKNWFFESVAVKGDTAS